MLLFRATGSPLPRSGVACRVPGSCKEAAACSIGKPGASKAGTGLTDGLSSASSLMALFCRDLAAERLRLLSDTCFV